MTSNDRGNQNGHELNHLVRYFFFRISQLKTCHEDVNLSTNGWIGFELLSNFAGIQWSPGTPNKYLYINGCFNWIPNLYIRNGWK